MQNKPIVINTRHLIVNKLEGIGRFTFEIVRRLVEMHPEEEFIFLFDRKPDPSFLFAPNVTPIVVYPPARHPLLWHIWFQWRVPSILKKYKAKLFVSPDGFLPLASNIPQVAVIHDLNFEHRPEDLPKGVCLFYKKYFPLFARKADRICTVSQYSKQDIENTYHIPAGNIDIIYNGASNIFRPLPPREQERIRRKIVNGDEYLIYVGSLHPRKNIINLLNAFDLYKIQQRGKLHLVIVGEPMYKNDEISNTYNGLVYRDSVHFLGYLSMTDLAKYMASAKALVLVSHFEGFGIPIIEAMACDVPVIVSQTTSMPEVAGTAGFYVNPDSLRDIADAFSIIDSSPEVRTQLIENGQQERKRFSWDKSAQKLWESMQTCLKAR